MFAPDGTTITRNAQTDSEFAFVDFEPYDADGGGLQTIWSDVNGDLQQLNYGDQLNDPDFPLEPQDIERAYPFQRFDDEEVQRTRDWLRARGNSIEGGTSEIQLNIIAKRVLGLPD